MTLIDTVAYQNLLPGQEYQVVGTLMDKETEKPVEVDGKPATSEAVFTPENADGTVDVTFTFDGNVLKGKTVVVFESLLWKEKEIAVHADLSDEGQTIYFPEIGTTAKDTETNSHVSKADEEVTIVDTVSYQNLVPGKEYKVSGVLMDKEIGEELLVLWSSIFVTLMANKIGGLQFGIYRNCQISSRVFHTAVAALPLTKANRSDFE